MVDHLVFHEPNQFFHINGGLDRIFSSGIEEVFFLQALIQPGEITVFTFPIHDTGTENGQFPAGFLCLPCSMNLFCNEFADPVRSIRGRKCFLSLELFSGAIRRD